MKEPKCKVCGGKHYAFQCWHKMRLKPTKSPQNPPLYPKTVKGTGRRKESRRALINRLDALTSAYVRRSHADCWGRVRCYTCGALYKWTDIDCGHFIKRRYTNTRWDVDNLRPQCQHCNRTLGGNYEVYTAKMTKEIGQEGVDALWSKARANKKISTAQLSDMVADLEYKIDHMFDSVEN